MALQGTLETFALPDVLRLLASTKKTGQLRLTGARGSGSIWLEGGAIVDSQASAAPRADGATEVVFELLRFKDGDFVFDADEVAPDSGSPAEVEETLGAAEALLSEWKTIEAVVPSLDGWVSLAPELPGEDITLDGSRWAQIVAIGGGITVGDLGERFGQGELPVSRTVKELLEIGLVELGEAPVGAPAAAEVAFLDEPAPEAEPAFEATFELEALDIDPDVGSADGPTLTVVDDEPSEGLSFSRDSFSGDSFDPDALVIEPPSYGGEPVAEPDFSLGSAHVETPPQTAEDDLTDAAEIARQLANLSPKAAKAVAAAAKATTQEEREAALAEVDDEEEPINRGLLLKFLGSVNG